MTARILLPVLLALTLGVSAAVLVACGGRDHLIPGTDAAALEQQLSDLKAAVDGGACDTADTSVAKLTNSVANLPKSVNADLRDRLSRGVANLAKKAPSACLNVTTVTESVPATTQLVTPPPDTTSTPVTPPPDTTSTPVEPPVTSPTDPNGTGGISAP